MKTKSETTDKEYQEQVEHWTDIVRAVLTAEGNILEQNRPILKDESKTNKERADIYCRNIAEEVLRVTYARNA